ncbi:nuclear transport factor 2 family protein [Ferrimonas sp. SCSIO 43195]|uniref:nuclear transport factor 2 family protein n=1 Tax=Ferrimonas sp. SCSIO 43195 TaxID=2822844 RepID=UPI0020755A8D|nr:nuclear transport factor 2 family protein [Ferrimonas sp. SCSIO 43195]USD37315.1 nuclear transport factor 2 family protein [Ferrimonas sp. SCSIO 43195]
MKSWTKTAITSTVVALSLATAGCSNTSHQQPEPLTHKEKVTALLKSIETGEAEPVSYINPNKYIQHNLGVADGLAGFGAALQALPEGSARVDTVRVFQDGDFVFAHTDYNFFGPKIGFDIFRFEQGLIVEHWDNLQQTPDSANPSGRTMIDGPVQAEDLDSTEANKVLVKGFVNDVLVSGKMDTITQYIEPNYYLQHNPGIADGLDGLGSALAAMAEQGITMEYQQVHRVLGEGNFVLTVSEGTLGGQHTSFYDLFRVENGKIVEHWDTIEAIPPQSEWKNGNGKF